MKPLKLKATTMDGGFALHLIGVGDLGEELCHAESVVVEMADGRTLGLYRALKALIRGRVTGMVVWTDHAGQSGEWLH